MKYQLIQDFLQSGYLIRNENWNPNECLGLSIGGVISTNEYDYRGLGVSSKANDILLKLNDQGTYQIEPHVIRFNGPNNVNMEYVPTTREQMIDDWGIFLGDKTDFLLWKQGNILKNELGQILTIYQTVPDGSVLVDNPEGNTKVWYPIFLLYQKGFRQIINKSNLN